MPWRLKTKAYSGQMTLPKTQHPYNTDFLCTWAGKTSGTILYSPLQWADICLSCLSYSKEKVKSSLLSSSNFEPDFVKLHRSRCLPLLTFQNTADSTLWKLEEINVGTFGNLYRWTSVCPSSLAKRCPFISNTVARGMGCHVETLYCLTVDNKLYSNRMTVTEVMQCFS